MDRTIGIIFANYTNDKLKSLVTKRAIGSIPFGGRYRLIDFPMSNMVNAGIRYLSVVTPYNYRSLIEHIGDGKNWGIGRKAGHLFILPGSMYGMRSAYTKFLLRDLLQNRAFVERSDSSYVLCSASGVICNMDCNEILEFHKSRPEPVTLVYKENIKPQSGMFLTIDEKGLVTDINYGEEKMAKLFLEYILIDREFLLQIMDWYKHLDHMDILEIIRENFDKIPTNAYAYKGYVRSINSVLDYMRASMDLMEPAVREELFHNERTIYTNVQDKAPAHYTPTSEVKNSFISAGTIIKGKVENCIIFRNVIVEEGAEVKNCILMQYSKVGKDAIVNDAICDKYVKIGAGRHISGELENPVLISKDKEI